MKRFYLRRNQDASGVSGTGNVAEGCQFDTGWCALVWLTSDKDSDEVHGYYRSIERLEEIHGHGGMTQVVWVDDESSNFVVKTETVSSSLRETSPVFCGHANECPSVCPCRPGCYCKTRTCKSKGTSDAYGNRITAYDLGAAGRSRKTRDTKK